MFSDRICTGVIMCEQRLAGLVVFIGHIYNTNIILSLKIYNLV